MATEIVRHTMEHKKSTKGTEVFGRDDGEVSQVYISKIAFRDRKVPKEITICITTDEE